MIGAEMASEIVETASLTMEDWWCEDKFREVESPCGWVNRMLCDWNPHDSHKSKFYVNTRWNTRRRTDWCPESMKVSEKVRKLLAKWHFGGTNNILIYETHCPDTVSVLCSQGTAPKPMQLWETDSGSYWTSTSELKLSLYLVPLLKAPRAGHWLSSQVWLSLTLIMLQTWGHHFSLRH